VYEQKKNKKKMMAAWSMVLQTSSRNSKGEIMLMG